MKESNILVIGFALAVIGALGMLYVVPSYTGWSSWGGPGYGMMGYQGSYEAFQGVPYISGLGGMMSRYQTPTPKYTSNGELIYYTGVDENGYQIIPNGGPNWLYMHGGSCVDCHGKGGRGGIVPMMCTEETPAITYKALTEEEQEEEEHVLYTDETIKIAITKGIEPNNETVDWCMPRWDMSEKDLDDLIDYLKTLE